MHRHKTPTALDVLVLQTQERTTRYERRV